MTLKITLVRLGALGLLLFGLAYLVAPREMTALVGMNLGLPSAVGDVRASYGGLPIALAIFLWLCATPDRARLGGLLLVLTGVGLAASRVLSATLDGAPNVVAITLFVVEIVTAMLGAIAMRNGAEAGQIARA
jgi:hypothetical protein